MRFIIVAICCIIQIHVIAQPRISSFSPSSGPIGTIITITGTGFSSNINNNVVYIGAVRGVVSAASATSITVTVSPGSSYEPITITTAGLTAYSKNPFNVTFSGGGNISSNSLSTRIDINGGTNGPVAMLLKDLDNDGKADVVSANLGTSSSGNAPSYLTILKNISSIGNLTFNTSLNFASESFHYFIGSGDIDGDGKPDILIPSYNIGRVQVFKNSSSTGAISFSAPLPVLSQGAYGITVADFDGDGLPDFATTNNESQGRMSIHRNTSFGGVISFAPYISYTTGSTPRSVTHGYINDDNKPDLIVANQYGQTVSVFINTSVIGSVSFSSKIDFSTPTSSYPQCVKVGDLDGDGKTDIAVSNNDISAIGTISLFRNTGSGSTVSFAPRYDLTTGPSWNPFNLALNDIDGDGKPEVVTRHQFNSNISVFRNSSTSGSLTFQPKVDFSCFDASRSLAVGDLDNDGKPDIAAGSYSSLNYSFFTNTIGAPTISSFSPLDACSGSTITINGTNFNGTTSVAFGGVQAASFTIVSDNVITAIIGSGASGSVSVTSPAGTEIKTGFTYTGQCIIPPVITSFTPVTGIVGTAVTITGQNFSPVMENNIVYFGAVKAIVTNATNNTINAIVPAGTSNSSITVTTNSLTAYSANHFSLSFNGGGICDDFTDTSFETKIDFAVGADPYHSIVTDADNDGKPDVITANYSSNNISLLKNNSTPGTVAFLGQTGNVTGDQPIAIAYGDLDGDGKQDIAVTNSNSSHISVYINTSSVGNISYGSKVDFQTGTNPRGISIRDIDLDGKPDIIVTNFSSNSISVLRNTSLGSGVITFAAQQIYSTGMGPLGVFVSDIDGDNKPDIAVTNVQSDNVSIFKNIGLNPGNLTLAAKQDFSTGSQPVSVFINDLNNDNKPDMAISNSASTSVSVIINASAPGTITFNSRTDYTSGLGPFGISIADLNGDHKPDICTANVFDATISVLRNTSTNGSSSFAQKVDYSTGASPRNILIADIDADGRPDIISNNSSDNSISILRNKITTAGQVCKWLGTIDQTWENPGNWSCNRIPDGNSEVIIDCAQIVMINSNATCKSIDLKSNTLLEVKDGAHLVIME